MIALARAWATRRRADRDLLHLARTSQPIRMSDDPMRSPEWCHMHNCHRSQCQH